MNRDLALVAVEELLDELARRFPDGYVFLARVVGNERMDGEPIVSWYPVLPPDMFVASGLARMLVKMTDATLAAGLEAESQAADDLDDQGHGDGEK